MVINPKDLPVLPCGSCRGICVCKSKLGHWYDCACEVEGCLCTRRVMASNEAARNLGLNGKVTCSMCSSNMHKFAK